MASSKGSYTNAKVEALYVVLKCICTTLSSAQSAAALAMIESLCADLSTMDIEQEHLEETKNLMLGVIKDFENQLALQASRPN